MALANYALGRKAESDANLAQLIEESKVAGPFQIAEVYSFRREIDQAFHWLDQAFLLHDGGVAEIKGDPLLKNLGSDPRYAAFLQKMHLPL